MRMQKGICIELKDDRSIFVLPNGQFVKGVPTTELAVGEEGYFYPHVAKKMFARKIIWAPVLTVFAVLAILFSVFSPPEEAYAYVQVQINPGVELGVNEDGKIITMRGLNSDGEELATKVEKWKNQPLNIVLEKIFSLSVKNHTEEITIATVSESKASLPLEAMVKNVSSKTVENNVKVRLMKATKAQWRKSVKEKVPVSKLVSHSILVKSDKPPLLYPKKEKTEKARNVDSKPKVKKVTNKDQRKQQSAKVIQEKLKEPHSLNNTQRESALPQQKKTLPKTAEKEKTSPKVQDKKTTKPKEKEKKKETPPNVKEKKKEAPLKTEEKKTATLKPEEKKTPPPKAKKKKEASPKDQKKKKEKPKPDAKKKVVEKKVVEKKKPNASQKEKKPNKQPRKSKDFKGKKE